MLIIMILCFFTLSHYAQLPLQPKMVLPAYWIQGALKGGEISTLKGVPQAQEVLNSKAQGGPGTDQMHYVPPSQRIYKQ